MWALYCHPVVLLFLWKDCRWKEQSFEAISIAVGDGGLNVSILCTASTYSCCACYSCRLEANSNHYHFVLEIARVRRGEEEMEGPRVACENPSYLKKCVE